MTEKTEELDNYLANHYIHRSNWLRAAVLGANDGILSTASLAIGVAAASDIREPIILATVAGLGCWCFIHGCWGICFGKFSNGCGKS